MDTISADINKTQSVRKCPYCAEEIEQGDLFCNSCGKDLREPNSNVIANPEFVKCPYCAETIKYEAIVCRFCGRDVKLNPNALTPPPQSTIMVSQNVSGGDLAAAFLLPIIGLILSVVYMLKTESRSRGFALMAISIIAWVVWWVICSFSGNII